MREVILSLLQDAALLHVLGEVLSQLRGEGMSLLLVEHDMDFVMTLTDRLVVVEFGTKLTEGTPDVVRDDPGVRAAYLGVEH